MDNWVIQVTGCVKLAFAKPTHNLASTSGRKL